ncbi:hypothetical protein HMSSN139_10070 [Paenibacillus sp. HMSSN-139]|nr:hypothetical protein HMSSN139_10070 [Paenibacillus sp. HMSSN-139]
MEGRFKTHSCSRWRLCTVWDLALMPSMQDRFSHQAEDIGAKLAVPFSLRVLISTTEVPK